MPLIAPPISLLPVIATAPRRRAWSSNSGRAVVPAPTGRL